MTIDLNCDMAELPELEADGTHEALLRHVSSINVSCGAHAGNDDLIRTTILAAKQRGVAVGAHPGYPDRENFGRTPMAMSREQVAETVHQQLVHVEQIAEEYEVPVRYVKPHGALYNVAVKDQETALGIVDGVRAWRPGTILVGLAGSRMLEWFAAEGFRTAAEGFADRAYEADGTLRPRTEPGAVHTDPALAAQQALSLVRGELPIRIDTICIHSDTPGAAAIAEAVSRAFLDAGFAIAPLTI
jgi:5-oxoprolinase (ATP-hydrolysing) subunit A